MHEKTNKQRLMELSDEQFAIFLCHVIKSNSLTMDDISEILKEYENDKPADYDSMLVWLRSAAY